MALDNIQDNLQLEEELSWPPMRIFVMTHTGKTIPLHAMCIDTVGSVKVKIQDTEDIAPYQQRLIFNGRVLKDDNVLRRVNIQRESTLHLAFDWPRGTQIFIKTITGKRIPFDVSLDYDTIDNVKDLIQGRTCLLKHMQRLTFAGNELDRDFVLRHYNIQKESTLDLALAYGGWALV